MDKSSRQFHRARAIASCAYDAAKEDMERRKAEIIDGLNYANEFEHATSIVHQFEWNMKPTLEHAYEVEHWSKVLRTLDSEELDALYCLKVDLSELERKIYDRNWDISSSTNIMSNILRLVDGAVLVKFVKELKRLIETLEEEDDR